MEKKTCVQCQKILDIEKFDLKEDNSRTVRCLECLQYARNYYRRRTEGVIPKQQLQITHPEIAAQYDTERNLIPLEKISPSSRKVVYWICKRKSHVWRGQVARVVNGRSCPECFGQGASEKYNLKTEFPQVLGEWNYECNDKDPSFFASGSRKKVWWRCKKKGHHFRMPIYRRTVGSKNSRGKLYIYSCPFCSGQAACNDNCLATIRPDIAKEWHPIKNTITPHDITSGSGKRVWWICSRGHEWEVRISSRICNSSGCPFCSNRRVCNDNCLASTHPHIAKEWNLKNKLKSTEVTYGSERKVWWLCKKEHEYKARIKDRTYHAKPTGCPICLESRGERRIRRFLEWSDIEFIVEKSWNDLKDKGKLRYDSYIPKFNLLIEYDGSYHFDNTCGYNRGTPRRDLLKTRYAVENYFSFMRISYKEFSKIEILISEMISKIKNSEHPQYMFSNPELYTDHISILSDETIQSEAL